MIAPVETFYSLTAKETESGKNNKVKSRIQEKTIECFSTLSSVQSHCPSLCHRNEKRIECDGRAKVIKPEGGREKF